MAQTQMPSAGSAIKTRPIKGFGRLGRWLNSLLADLKATEVVAGLDTTVSQIPGGGRSVTTSGAGIETVTGAVNGVPATLRVKTDGSGWKAI